MRIQTLLLMLGCHEPGAATTLPVLLLLLLLRFFLLLCRLLLLWREWEWEWECWWCLPDRLFRLLRL